MTPKFSGDVGRLKYSTRAKARKASKKLNLNGRTHNHKFDNMNGGKRFYMPGKNHRELSDALVNRGLPPEPARGSSGMGGGMGASPDESSKSGGLFDLGMSEGDEDPLGFGEDMSIIDEDATMGDSDGDDEMELY
jgi:hypothetical protein